MSWLASAARLFREEGLDCSPAHVIESARLAESLAALRNRPGAGLRELCEALQTVVCMGEEAPMRLIARRLITGEKLGRVPEGVPAVPLQRDTNVCRKSSDSSRKPRRKRWISICVRKWIWSAAACCIA